MLGYFGVVVWLCCIDAVNSVGVIGFRFEWFVLWFYFVALLLVVWFCELVVWFVWLLLICWIVIVG